MRINQIIDDYKRLDSLNVIDHNDDNSRVLIVKRFDILHPNGEGGSDLIKGMAKLLSNVSTNQMAKPDDFIDWEIEIWGSSIVRNNKLIYFNISKTQEFLLKAYKNNATKPMAENLFKNTGKLRVI